ncbi:hypothetical protein DXG03_006265 [Asterophora parasitica]|uniref:C2H2-type domain-containing protein n=1 Tax=Asterophora parasitica TaxID=117018 RepID=A0A9P7G8Y5_9AGAR|nr:hypothetical protein DXG03_006265 [Asterophora parasitica]
MAQPPDPLKFPATNQEEEEEAEEWDEEDYDDEDDDNDIDAEAEEIARRLGEELWADLSKATAGQIACAPLAHESEGASVPLLQGNTSLSTSSRKSEAAIITMKAILAVVEHDPPARFALESAVISNSNGDNVLDTLKRLVTEGGVSKAIAISLSPVLVSLARSDILFGNLRHSNASSIQLDKGKRKREEADEGLSSHDPRAFKRPYVPEFDLHTQVNDAVRVITQALASSPAQPLDPALVSSIRLQLHQVFLFAVTSSAGGGRDMHALQEISGLIQVIGVLSGIQIGQPPDSHSQPHFPPNHSYPWLPAHPPASSTDIGTAVYPCLITGCKKTFSRLYSLRAHQRVHAIHRPYRCSLCPASFARNHDLKRHIKLHDRKAWKCGGCLKVFSRRDAIKRHKTGSKTRGPRSEACVTAEVLEVELDQEEGEDSMREERRAKLWSGIATSQADAATTQPPLHGYHDPSHVEEGEVHAATISAIQSSVLSLHGLLQAHVGGALGTPVGQTIHPSMDPAAGQATLASVIARAQMQNMPPKTTMAPVAACADITTAAAYCPVADQATLPKQVPHGTPTIGTSEESVTPLSSLSMYGLSDEQTKMLEEAIANAASAAQAQAEAEAALEEEEEEEEDYEDEEDESEGQMNVGLS